MIFWVSLVFHGTTLGKGLNYLHNEFECTLERLAELHGVA